MALYLHYCVYIYTHTLYMYICIYIYIYMIKVIQRMSLDAKMQQTTLLNNFWEKESDMTPSTVSGYKWNTICFIFWQIYIYWKAITFKIIRNCKFSLLMLLSQINYNNNNIIIIAKWRTGAQFGRITISTSIPKPRSPSLVHLLLSLLLLAQDFPSIYSSYVPRCRPRWLQCSPHPD